MAFQKAVKEQISARISLFGPPGSGKTWTGLLFSEVLKGSGRIALIDTERGKAKVYADRFDFDHEVLTHFAPADYTKAIREAASAKYPVLVIDSLSHAWVGEGGLLDQADQRGGKFEAWKDLTPQHRKLIDALLDYPGHVIVTMRSKMEYVVEQATNSKGREVATPRKVGLAPVQKDDTEYEFDLVLAMDTKNCARVMKSRCPAFEMESVLIKPGHKEAQMFAEWLGQGVRRPTQEQRDAIAAACATLGIKNVRSHVASLNGDRPIETFDEAEAVRRQLDAAIDERMKRELAESEREPASR